MKVIQPGDPEAKAQIPLLEAKGIDPNEVYRIEMEDEQMTVYRYARNEDGAFFVHDAGKFREEATHPLAGEIAVQEPLVVPLP